MIVIADYGMGNLGSIRNMLKRLGIEAMISAKPEDIDKADRVIIPGVGAFGKGIHQLRERGLEPVLRKKAFDDRVPVLGICLGMQLMTKASEENDATGLGWVDASTVHLLKDQIETRDVKVPHIGWNYVDPVRPHPLLADLPKDPRFYFVHGFRVVVEKSESRLLATKYGAIDIVSAFAVDNIVGVQFHPEKSHKFGMKLLANFAAWSGNGA